MAEEATEWAGATLTAEDVYDALSGVPHLYVLVPALTGDESVTEDMLNSVCVDGWVNLIEVAKRLNDRLRGRGESPTLGTQAQHE